ncbi:hypothetical protein HOO54_17800 [Bacillus sp. WMMC1349]|uniref:hypothetical protein n=1 Tax=Bacillus sp. WMMC1349 TaxID=2736254 RepID=UPI001554B8E4|nr:hypothetical protein [Bacillus sp. WMMC1349]NPC94020.1 hypothetical protein [Bacillus sp. WMMC1349]
MYDVLIVVKLTEVLTIDSETGEITRRFSGRSRDLALSQAVLESWDNEEEAKIVYEKGESECTAS